MRSRIGVVSMILLAWAGISYYMYCRGILESEPSLGGPLRTGGVLFFLWLAWPDIAAFPRWVLHASIPTAILVAIYPKLLFIIVPSVLLMLFLQPKTKTVKTKPRWFRGK